MPDDNMHVEISIDSATARRATQAIRVQMHDLRPLWPLVGRVLRPFISANFRNQGDSSGDPWPALSPAYAAAKAVKYPGRPLLVETGQLRGFLTGYRGPRIESHPTEMIFVVDHEIAVYHQDGTKNADLSERMPARPPMPRKVPQHIKAELEQTVIVFFAEILARWGYL